MTDTNAATVNRCTECRTLALQLAPGEEVECETCGGTLSRDDAGEAPNRVQFEQ